MVQQAALQGEEKALVAQMGRLHEQVAEAQRALARKGAETVRCMGSGIVGGVGLQAGQAWLQDGRAWVAGRARMVAGVLRAAEMTWRYLCTTPAGALRAAEDGAGGGAGVSQAAVGQAALGGAALVEGGAAQGVGGRPRGAAQGVAAVHTGPRPGQRRIATPPSGVRPRHAALRICARPDSQSVRAGCGMESRSAWRLGEATLG